MSCGDWEDAHELETLREEIHMLRQAFNRIFVLNENIAREADLPPDTLQTHILIWALAMIEITTVTMTGMWEVRTEMHRTLVVSVFEQRSDQLFSYSGGETCISEFRLGLRSSCLLSIRALAFSYTIS